MQLVRIQLDEGAELRAQGAKQSESVMELAAQRGAILDRRGRALVVNTARYEVAADPTVVGFDARAEELYSLLGRAHGSWSGSLPHSCSRPAEPAVCGAG